VGATAPLQDHTGAEAHIHEADRFLYEMLPVQAALLGPAGDRPPTRGSAASRCRAAAGRTRGECQPTT
jgi:hypothetical protein